VLHADAPAPGRPAEYSLPDTAARIPSTRTGKRTHPDTVKRWILEGVKLRNGSRLRLAARRYPGGWAVAEDALRDFTDALTADRTPAPRRDQAAPDSGPV
jgi:hypothetical protein